MLISTLIFFAILLLLVLVHEFGHFIVAKLAGIRVDEFAFGFPPKLFGKKIGETEYRFNLLPIGGYVKIYGEDPSEVTGTQDTHRSFAHKPRWVQALVLVAGVAMNLLCAWALFTIAYTTGVETSVTSMSSGQVLSSERTLIASVAPGSPAEAIGVAPGDTLVSLATFTEFIEPKSTQEVRGFLSRHTEGPMTIGIQKKDQASPVYIPITPEVKNESTERMIGIGVNRVGLVDLPVHLAMVAAVETTWKYTVGTAQAFWGLIVGIFQGEGNIKELTGPIGIVGIVDQVRIFGFTALLIFSAIISINLAVLNLIPFPALDGGRLLFVAIESVIRRPLPLVFQAWANTIGFGLLLLLMLIVTWQDIVRLVS